MTFPKPMKIPNVALRTVAENLQTSYSPPPMPNSTRSAKSFTARRAENERTWPHLSEPKISCSCNVLKLNAQARGTSGGSSRQVGDYLYCVKPRCEATGHKNAQPTHPERDA
jgi:hypothetical protein